MKKELKKQIKQDEFVEQTWNVLAYVEEHPKAFLYGAAALVVAIVAIWSATGIVKRYAAKSSDALLRGQTALEAPVARAAATPVSAPVSRPAPPPPPAAERKAAPAPAPVAETGSTEQLESF